MKPVEAFRERLLQASYHYADDSTKEWGAGSQCLNEACDIAVAERWSDEKITELVNDIRPIMSVRTVLEYVNRRKSVTQPRQ